MSLGNCSYTMKCKTISTLQIISNSHVTKNIFSTLSIIYAFSTSLHSYIICMSLPILQITIWLFFLNLSCCLSSCLYLSLVFVLLNLAPGAALRNLNHGLYVLHVFNSHQLIFIFICLTMLP